MSLTPNILYGVVMNNEQLSISAIPYLWLCLLSWQDLQDLSCDWMVLCIPFQYITDLLVSLRHEWIGLGNGDTS
jgi:hypothetical protein